MDAIKLTIPDSAWQPAGEDEPDEWARIILRDGVTINGTGFHLEGWAVETAAGDVQHAVSDDENLGYVHLGVGADGRWETVTIREREYVLVMSPHC